MTNTQGKETTRHTTGHPHMARGLFPQMPPCELGTLLVGGAPGSPGSFVCFRSDLRLRKEHGPSPEMGSEQTLTCPEDARLSQEGASSEDRHPGL